MKSYLFSILFGIEFLIKDGIKCSHYEEQLFKELFQDYNPLIRPVKKLDETINVSFSIALLQIISVIEKEQVLKTNVWLQVKWHDYQMQWKREKYGGIQSIRVPPNQVWTPDIVLFNNADGKYEASFKSHVVIYYNGDMNWVPPAIYKSSCHIDVKFFPFDEQMCELRFGSWTYNQHQLNFTYYNEIERHVTIKDYVVSGSWDLMDGPMSIQRPSNETDTLFDNSYRHDRVEFVCKLVIRRKTLFYTVNLIIPTVLISFLSIFVFYLPTDAGEKMTLSISILLALVVFLLLISKILPPTSIVIPLIAKYLLFTFIMNIITILCTVVIINYNYRTPRTSKMPYWMRRLFIDMLPRVLRMERPLKDEIKNEDERIEQTRINYIRSSRVISIATPPIMNSDQSLTTDNEEQESEMDSFLTKEVYEAVEDLSFIANQMRSACYYEEIRDDWKYIASVIDRLQLYIFFAVTSFGTLSILFNAPHILSVVDQNAILKKWDPTFGNTS
ncbi:unnamed protein product [Adineta steineri]|uniref:Uncharacterized protein n=1 Tax=Adineta steineri TaxID=433720 RepID=A0A813NRQ0_9BILA|nr:unnamed protein product [Adineta steineri]CAF0776716.1 unnamed protein product [Adineta steineri]CAF3896093.1 unnamed protein product [Adineta steineri]CAF4090436.1 unnamed protein product [Adineta steineri]